MVAVARRYYYDDTHTRSYNGMWYTAAGGEAHTHTHTVATAKWKKKKKENLLRALAWVSRAVRKSFYLTNTHGENRREKKRWAAATGGMHLLFCYLFIFPGVCVVALTISRLDWRKHTQTNRGRLGSTFAFRLPNTLECKLPNEKCRHFDNKSTITNEWMRVIGWVGGWIRTILG
jgi:hypothetical protein